MLNDRILELPLSACQQCPQFVFDEHHICPFDIPDEDEDELEEEEEEEEEDEEDDYEEDEWNYPLDLWW